MIDSPMATTGPKRRWKPSVLFWIVAAVVLLLVILFAVALGLWGVLFILGVVSLLTGLYTLLFKRRSWVGLPHRKSGAVVAIAGFVALIVGLGVGAATAAPGGSANKAALVSPVQQSASPTATNPTSSTCITPAETRKYNDQSLICTMGSDQRLVWMTEADSKRVVAAKAAADKAAADKVAAEKAEAEKAAAEKAAADKAAADRAASDKAAADKAAADQVAAQLAAEQAAQQAAQQAQQTVPQAPAAVYYKNCDAVRAAGAAPLYANQPGFRAALDRNSNGVACE